MRNGIKSESDSSVWQCWMEHEKQQQTNNGKWKDLKDLFWQRNSSTYNHYLCCHSMFFFSGEKEKVSYQIDPFLLCFQLLPHPAISTPNIELLSFHFTVNFSSFFGLSIGFSVHFSSFQFAIFTTFNHQRHRHHHHQHRSGVTVASHKCDFNFQFSILSFTLESSRTDDAKKNRKFENFKF